MIYSAVFTYTRRTDNYAKGMWYEKSTFNLTFSCDLNVKNEDV
ncbi:hypothetical protein ECW26_25460 [Escherichia coli W26]|nr:hypothetical protein ECW26_25460 [Escherichia coli W26]